ncbi:hypothetical protein SY91_05195 [Burkholderia cenocepacia]|uniref:hypothetical protein n=1 Tax=Burkholderia cenocepacia TaxID=95486 RepID=UPI001862CA32|nr:hypothetical protein [Burkholderia cenocepacia]QND97739.1 hypothetical protein SY91_05195 [Burkholderia cenocepacia]
MFAANYAFAHVKLYAAFLYGVGTPRACPRSRPRASARRSTSVRSIACSCRWCARREGLGERRDRLGVGYDHPLSKRTSLYARYLYMKNSGDARNTVVAGLQPQPGGTEQVFALGIVHRF